MCDAEAEGRDSSQRWSNSCSLLASLGLYIQQAGHGQQQAALHIQPEADVQMPEHVPHFIMHTPDVIRAICVMLSPWLQIAIL